MMTNVLYEISSMGRAWMLGSLRTGISRVVENVARELVARSDVAVRFGAYNFQGATEDYLAEEFPETAFAHTRWRSQLSRALYGRMSYPEGVSDPQVARNAEQGVKAAVRSFAVQHLKEYLRQMSRDALEWAHVYHAPSGEVSRQVAGSRLPIVLTIHDLIAIKFPHFFPSHTAAERDRFLGDLSPDRWYICDSECTRQDLLDTGRCHAERVSVAHLAAQDSFRPVGATEGREMLRDLHGLRGIGWQGRPYFLSVCTLEPRKNLASVVRAFAEYVRSEQAWEIDLVLCGATGWKNELLEQALSGAGDVRGQILLTGYVSDAQLPALYSGALAFIYVPYYEGFGLPPLEAMQCGAPVITSHTSSLPEVVGDAGLMVDPMNVGEIAAAMAAMAGDAARRDLYHLRGLERAAQFSWARTAEQSVRLYERARDAGCA